MKIDIRKEWLVKHSVPYQEVQANYYKTMYIRIKCLYVKVEDLLSYRDNDYFKTCRLHELANEILSSFGKRACKQSTKTHIVIK